jgi:putative protease
LKKETIKNISCDNNIEIMAPVGSWDALHSAINSGADSIYLGIGTLNMRSRSSSNFQISEIQSIVKICRENNVKLYITVNTVVYTDEIDNVNNLIRTLSESGADAVIASDMAVILACQKYKIPVHASTQLNISNIEAVRYFSKFVDVIVLARELNLKQISEITKTIKEENICGPSGNLIKIELFVHGALCMAISGKCYLSLDNFNLSANRGACIQVCRRGYRVEDIDKQVELEVDNEYIMSPKDLKTIDFLDKIIFAGVSVLKIEGRARSAEYVKTVVETYKDAVKTIKSGTFNKENIDKWNDKLQSVFNRGFWDGYYLGQKMGEWAKIGGSQATKTKEYVGKITNFFTKMNVMEVLLESGEISIGDEIFIIGNATGVVEIKIEEIRVNLKKVNKAIKGDICSIKTNEFLRRNDKIYKVIDNLLP